MIYTLKNVCGHSYLGKVHCVCGIPMRTNLIIHLDIPGEKKCLFFVEEGMRNHQEAEDHI